MKKVSRVILLILSFALTSSTYSQIGGETSYSFLNLTNSARIGALGGNLIAVKDHDANLGIQNPSLLNKEMDGFMSLNYVNYFADINYGYASFAKHIDSIGTFSASFLFANYGSFIKADYIGNQLATFTANDLGLVLSYGTAIDSFFSIGTNLKLLGSFYDIYTSYGIALDLSGTYHNPIRNFTGAVLIKNIGTQLKPYNETKEALPFEVQLALSKKLKQ